MSHLLWKYYWEDDVDKFRRHLASASQVHPVNKPSAVAFAPGSSPGGFPASPRGAGPRSTPRKPSGYGPPPAAQKGTVSQLSKAEINSRDHAGLTLLLRAAASSAPNAISFVEALLEHPNIDLHAQDTESGWNCLHRALYHGNISVARLLLEKERALTDALTIGSTTKIGQLIKTKDHEGNSPFDVYNASIALASLKITEDDTISDDESFEEINDDSKDWSSENVRALGEEVFTFGSNNNLSLGQGDEDDRQYPERISLQRPEHLIHRFHDEYLQEKNRQPNLEDSFLATLNQVPDLIRNRPLSVQDVVFSKYHSAVLTTDPISNVYVTGIGRGGRLGLGDENTRFTFSPVQGALLDKKVEQLALGQNHSMAVTSAGELFTWGANKYSQLGFTLPAPPTPDQEPISTSPRQVFGSLKKEFVQGVAASSIHSVAHTGSSLFCWGKNVGQLALMDADSRSLDIQTTPRKVAATLISHHGSISAISAIDQATTCLFEDHTVCVFTSYGYNMIKFPFQDGFANSPLQRSQGMFMSSRPDPGRREIHQITSGGETIAAITGAGDLFTMSLNQRLDGNLSATSTTNPSKIKDAITVPQCIWSSRKDGVKSVGVAENGSVIISTQSGAVWRRVKRAKVKDSRIPGAPDAKRKDFKFQRVPYITDIAAVRSSISGAYAAIRKDCEVTQNIQVDEPTLWGHMAPLLSLQGFKALNSKKRENKDTWKFQDHEVLKSQVDPMTYEVLVSTDLEDDLRYHVEQWNFANKSTGTIIRAESFPDLQVPVHSWILAGRSSRLRAALQKFQETGSYEIPDLLTINQKDGITVVELTGEIDMITLMNLVVYLYTDSVMPVWNFTGQMRPLAYRYRQVRNELMKIASKLKMFSLEAGVRIQTKPPPSMDKDFSKAIKDPAFFLDADTILSLRSSDAPTAEDSFVDEHIDFHDDVNEEKYGEGFVARIPVHSTMMCQRCPWFNTLFNGRSKGMWLEPRQATGTTSQVNIDLRHMNSTSFSYVLRHLYADVGDDLFCDVVSENIDDFAELLMDIMGISDYLGLDRLAQICQRAMGRLVTTYNISTLLNNFSPYLIRKFKEAGLQYISLQMESMLENHLLDNLQKELLVDLDKVVRKTQRDRFPIARDGVATELLHELYPNLKHDIEEERQIRVKEMAFRAAIRDDEKKVSTSFNKTRFGSLDDLSPATPTPERTRRISRAAKNEPFSPDLRPKDSHADLIFDMDEEDSSILASPSPTPVIFSPGERGEVDRLSMLSEPWRDAKGKAIQGLGTPTKTPPGPPSRPGLTLSTPSEEPLVRRPSESGKAWGSSALPTTRLDLKEMMAEARPTKSALSAGLAAEKRDNASKTTPQKISQKEKKRQLQQQAEETARREAEEKNKPQAAWTNVGDKKIAPWLKTEPAPKSSLKDMLSSANEKGSSSVPKPKPLVAAESSGKSLPRRAASPDTRMPGQKSSSNNVKSTPTKPSPASSSSNHPEPQPVQTQPITPHSKSYITRAPQKPEQEMGLGLADIIGEQRREQESVREAVAKRSLQEIQQEQEFQEWWDMESRRMQEEEARRQANRTASNAKSDSKKGKNRGRGGGGGGPSSAKPKETKGDKTAGRGKDGAQEKSSGKNNGGGRKQSGGVQQSGGGASASASASNNASAASNGNGGTRGRGRGGGAPSRKAT